MAIEGLTRVLEDRFQDPDFIALVTADPKKYPLANQKLEARKDTPTDAQ